MESLFRRLLNAGIGVASKTTKFTQDVINDLIAKGKISDEEGKRIMADLEKEGNEQRQVFENELNAYLEKALQKMDIPTREEFRRLEARVSVLENSQPGASQVGTFKQ